MMQSISAWRSFVNDLVDGEYTAQDFVEVDISLMERGTLPVAQSLHSAEAAALEKADALFRERAVACMEKAGLLTWYRKASIRHSAADWWWHL